jgi:hypothetical protein
MSVSILRCSRANLCHGCEIFEHLSRCFLLGAFFGRTLGTGDEFPHLAARQADFNGEILLVFRSLFFHKFIERLTLASGLKPFLQGRFEIHHRHGGGFEIHMSEFRIDNRAQNELPRDLPSAVEIKRGENRFQGVDEQSGFTSSAALFFAFAQAKIMAELELFGDPEQMPLTDQVSAELGELSFVEAWEANEQSFAGDEAEHSITEEFEKFVVGTRPGTRAQSLEFARLRAVRQRLLDQFAALEVISQALFQRVDVSLSHDVSGVKSQETR